MEAPWPPRLRHGDEVHARKQRLTGATAPNPAKASAPAANAPAASVDESTTNGGRAAAPAPTAAAATASAQAYEDEGGGGGAAPAGEGDGEEGTATVGDVYLALAPAGVAPPPAKEPFSASPEKAEVHELEKLIASGPPSARARTPS